MGVVYLSQPIPDGAIVKPHTRNNKLLFKLKI